MNATPGHDSCDCPETDGKVYHQRGTCTDLVVAALDWYADGPAQAATATPGRVLFDSLRNSAVAEFGLSAEDFAAWEQVPESQRIRMEAAAQDVIADDRAAQAPGTEMRVRELREAIADRNCFLSALKRLADGDTWVLGEGLGGGEREELHVRINLARKTLGFEACDCSDCTVSLG